jgi:hypothetical protein
LSAINDYPNLESVTEDFTSRAQNLNNTYWLAVALVKQDSWDCNLLNGVENIISQMPPRQKQELTKKFDNLIPQKSKSWKEEYDREFLDLLIEVLGWDWLSKKYNSSAVEFRNTPDLEVLNKCGNVVAAMECKNFWISKEEESRIESIINKGNGVYLKPTESRLILLDFSKNPFLKKVKRDLCKAEEQLDKTKLKKNRFILINFSFDFSLRTQYKKTKDLIRLINRILKPRTELIAFSDYQSSDLTDCD